MSEQGPEAETIGRTDSPEPEWVGEHGENAPDRGEEPVAPDQPPEE